MTHMTSWLWRHGITLTFLGFASILPATAGAQPPVYLTQWGSYGTGDGQFNYPGGVAVDASGNVYVADRYNYRIQVFAPRRVRVLPGGANAGDGPPDLQPATGRTRKVNR